MLRRDINSGLFTNIGVALALVGVPLGMYFNYLFPFVKWSPIFMFFSFLFIISSKNLFLGRFPSFNKMFIIIFIYQLLMIFYGIFSTKLTTQYLSFHIYILSLLVAYSTNELRYSYKNVIVTTFYISAICSLLGAFFLWSGLVTGEKAWELRQDNEEYALEQFTVVVGAITNFICALCWQVKNIKLKLIVWLFIALDAYIIFRSGKRTPVFVSLIILIIYSYKTGGINNKLLLRYFKIFMLLAILAVSFYINVDFFQKLVDNFFYNFYNGVLNILGNTDVRDTTGSAIARYNSRKWTYEYIENNFSFLNYIFGAGYMTRWIDNPLLQSYLDMGLFGLLFYILLILIYPIKSYIKGNSTIVLFAILLCVYNFMASISSGNPYAYIKHIPVVFLAFTVNLERKNNRKSSVRL
ncbi:hypothetical protein DMB65_00550 [Flavobacterium cheongpyeongense]|uniref:O-antigen ligase domain-containing protein n=1 Tax=Flavobacterium cheongpyeongense TaxID=2212651 RepID=A0A2V4BXU8_9FLAO|nr:hypothetical protein [Flavobacterium cheongpyeongense]PXY42550.1 hypothetical protein DMB65_00550 [Flavobacterium cheongpyeongense]